MGKIQLIALCGATETATEWKPVLEQWPNEKPDDKELVHCCNRLAPLRDLECRFETAFEGYVAGWYFRCKSDAGCNINPGYKRTAHLRYYETE